MAKNTRQRADLALNRIEAALRRCDEGDHGDCLHCDEAINPRRLDPAAPLCIACAEKAGVSRAQSRIISGSIPRARLS